MIKPATTMGIMYEYCDAVLERRFPVCKALVKIVEKFLREVNDESFEYVFDEDLATTYCEMIPKVFRHSKGKWAGQAVELEPWQIFLFANIFGWVTREPNEDGKRLRRYRKVFVLMGRKNGKSTLAAIVEIILAALDGEAAAEVYVGATKQMQANIIHNQAAQMVEASRVLSQMATVHKNNIMFPGHSFARPMCSDKGFDGANTSGVLFDELHAWKEHHRDFFDTMVTGGGSREQPLLFIITTAGTQKSLIFNEELEYARKVVDGTVRDNKLFALIYETDKEVNWMADDFDMSLLMQANPNYGVSVFEDYLRGELHEARHKRTAKNRFRLKHANQCGSTNEEGITEEEWDACAGKLSDWGLSDGVAAGVDLGGKDDLASYGLSAKFLFDKIPVRLIRGRCRSCKEHFADLEVCPTCKQNVYKYEGKTCSFISEKTKRDLDEEPFRTWIEEGRLVVCQYVIDALIEDLIDTCYELGIEYVAYDPHQAQHPSEVLEKENFKPVRMPQNHAHFNETIKNVETEISESRFIPDQDDEIFRWAATNVVYDINTRGLAMCDKASSKDKIDPFVAYLMARRAVNLAEPRATGSLVL